MAQVEINIILENINFISAYIFIFGALIFLFLGLRYIYLERFFFPDFEKRYNLNYVRYQGFFPSKRAGEVWRSKCYILVALAHHYISPYWFSYFRRKTERFVEKREQEQDPYFLACRHLIDENYPIKGIQKMEYLEDEGVFKRLIMRDDDLKVFLRAERYVIGASVIGIISTTAGVFNKFGMPYVFQYFGLPVF